MKKLLLVLGILSISAIGYAGAKEDYAQAEVLAKQNKITETVKLLQGVSSSGDKEYAGKANLQLGAYYTQQKQYAEGKKYLLLAWNDAAITGMEKRAVAELLYGISLQEKNYTEAEKYLTWANTDTKGESVDVVSSLIIFYFDSNQKAKGDATYSDVVKTKKPEFKSEVSYNVGRYYLTKNNTEEAKKYLESSYTQSPNGVVPAGYLLAQIEVNKDNPAGAEKRLLDMNTKTGNKDVEVLSMLGNYYLQNGDLVKAESYLKRVASADSKDVETRILLLGIYEMNNDAAKISGMLNELKPLAQGGLNKSVGIAFTQLGNPALAEKYFKKSINDDKDNQSKVLLGQLYALTGNKTEAVKILKEAEAAKVQGATEVLKKVEAMK